MIDHEKEKRYKLYLYRLISSLTVSVIIYLLLIAAANFIVNLFLSIADSLTNWQSDLSNFSISKEMFFHSALLSIPWAVAVLAIPAFLFSWKIIKMAEKLWRSIKLDYFYGNIEGSARWATKKDLRKNFTRINYKKLGKAKLSGILVAEEKRFFKWYVYVDATNSHTLLIGMTRSGKGVLFILRSIESIAKPKEKASMIIFDPKMENLTLTHDMLVEEGYRVVVVNLDDPKRSVGINTLVSSIAEYKLQMGKEEKDRDFSKLNSIVSELALMQTANPKSDPIWPECAKSLLTALILYLLQKGYDNGTIDKLNMYTVCVFFLEKGADDKRVGNVVVNALDQIFQSLDIENIARQAYATSKFASGEMRSSIFSTLSSNLEIYKDAGITQLTSKTDFDYADLAGDEPVALFFVIPDDKKARHVLATTMVKQAYNQLVDLANANGGKLSRRVYILGDEIGNMPAFVDLSEMVTVSLGRGIQWLFAVQNDAQMIEKYGEHAYKTISGNVMNTVYVLSSDLDTNKRISDMMGNATKETSTQNGRYGSVLEADNTHGQSKGRPLANHNELFLSDWWEIKVIRPRCYPVSTKLRPFFEIYNTKLGDPPLPVAATIPKSELLMDYRDSEPLYYRTVNNTTISQVVDQIIKKERENEITAKKAVQGDHQDEYPSGSEHEHKLIQTCQDFAEAVRQQDLIKIRQALLAAFRSGVEPTLVKDVWRKYSDKPFPIGF